MKPSKGFPTLDKAPTLKEIKIGMETAVIRDTLPAIFTILMRSTPVLLLAKSPNTICDIQLYLFYQISFFIFIFLSTEIEHLNIKLYRLNQAPSPSQSPFPNSRTRPQAHQIQNHTRVANYSPVRPPTHQI